VGLTLRAQARRMKHLLRQDELLLAVDFVTLRVRYHDESQTRELGTSVISLSTAAVYLQPQANSTVTKIPYANIKDLAERDSQTVIQTGTASYVFISGAQAKANLYDQLAAHLQELEIAQFKVEVGDAGLALLTLRPIEENGEPVWLIHGFGEVDFMDSSTQRKIESAINPTLLAEHPLPDWPSPNSQESLYPHPIEE
jgi:hypothetical protein